MNKYSVTNYYKKMTYDALLRSIIKIGFNYEYKGPSFVWYRLSKNTINKNNLSERMAFYSDGRLPKEYRVDASDYKHSGYDRGHLANDASFDVSKERLKDVYTFANIIPQKHYANAYAWGAIEKYTRYVTMKLKYTYVVNLVLYGKDKIGNNVGVPKAFYKVIINKKHKFLKIFRVKQDDKISGLKIYNITYERLIKDIAK